MNKYGFLLAHDYEILKGYVEAESEVEAKTKVLNEDWGDIVDEYDSEILTDGYEIIEMWS